MMAGVLRGAPLLTSDLDVVDLLARAPELDLGEGLKVHVIDLPTLIELKEKAGRPKDLAVLPVLRATLAETLRRS
jgi:predicted nucleotidyltransferase